MPSTKPIVAPPIRGDRAGVHVPSLELGRRIKAAREKAGLTQVEAARRLKISQRTYAERELGTTMPYSLLLELVKVLEFDRAILCPELLATDG